MKLLLDTHALLWWLSDDGRLEAKARDLISDPANDVIVSAASLWEVVVKVRVGKLEADIREIVEAIDQQGFTLLDITPAQLAALDGLPRYQDHRDPFDHLLIAQAIAEVATFVSKTRSAATPQSQRCPSALDGRMTLVTTMLRMRSAEGVFASH